MKTSAKVLKLKKVFLENITNYMKLFGDDPDDDAGYTQKHIDRCDAILTKYLAAIGKGKQTPQTIMTSVKTAVVALNALNDRCDETLIETAQREMLCELIQRAAKDAGLKTKEDITEEWREW